MTTTHEHADTARERTITWSDPAITAWQVGREPGDRMVRPALLHRDKPCEALAQKNDSKSCDHLINSHADDEQREDEGHDGRRERADQDRGERGRAHRDHRADARHGTD